MARLPEDWIDEVIARNDIIEVISEYVALKPQGKEYFGLCPFHNEKTPSFSVSPSKQLYHCFGCGEGGGLISFIMEIEHLEYIEAIKFLAERVGIPLPDEIDTEAYIRNKNYKEQLYEINRECALYYHKMLMSPEGKEALLYLKNRGFDLSTIKSFGLGYAPDSFDKQLTYLKSKGYTEKQLIDLGIVVNNTNKNRIYDRFRNRVMFPIIHPRGMVLGFGGRVMDPNSNPKYLNSVDSPVFNKSSILFGLNMVGRLHSLDHLIIVEGYMDVIALHRFGFKNAVASLGTSLTSDQAKLLSRYSPRVYIAFDGDSAGQAATLRGLDMLYSAGCQVRVIKFPKGMDPDETLNKYGPEYFNKLIDRSMSLIDYKLDRLQTQYDLNIPEDKVNFTTEAAGILAKVENIIERDLYIQRLEELTGVKARTISDQMAKIEATEAESSVKRNIDGNNRHTRLRKKSKLLLPGYIQAERHLIRLMAQSNNNAEKIFEKLNGKTFSDQFHQKILQVIKGLVERNAHISYSQVLSYIEDPEEAKKLVDIFSQEMEYDNIDSFISDCIDQVVIYQNNKKRDEIYKEIADIEQGVGSPDKYRMLLKELEELNKQTSKHRQERR